LIVYVVINDITNFGNERQQEDFNKTFFVS